MPLPQCLLVSSFLFVQARHLFVWQSVLWAISYFLLIVCAILKIYILLCVWVACAVGTMYQRAFLLNQGLLFLLCCVLAGQWASRYNILQDCWVRTTASGFRLTEFELQSSGLWGSDLSAEPSFWPLIYFTLEMGSYYMSWSAQTFSCSRGWPWVWDPALAFWMLNIQVYAVTSDFRYLSFHRPPPSIHKDICAPQSWALIYSTKLRRRVHVWMSRFLFLLL